MVICGAGFTGIELAAELPKRLSHLTDPRVVLVESANTPGPELGPILVQRSRRLWKTSALLSNLGLLSWQSMREVSLLPPERAVEFETVKATALTTQISTSRDALGRLYVDQHLRVPSVKDVFATGDAACALADSKDHRAFMSCQHANQLGRVSGHSAAQTSLVRLWWTVRSLVISAILI